MKYIDTFKSCKLKIPSKRTLSKHINEGIKVAVSNIDFLHTVIENSDDIMKPVTNEKLINTLRLIKEFHIVNCRYFLLEADFYVAYKYMFIVEDDWEYRFFVRRIYTLMHETQKCLVGSSGQTMKEIECLLGKECDNYSHHLHKLNKFLKDNDDKFKEVRNACEAHKDKDIDRQIEAIENISIVESLQLILKYNSLITNIGNSFIDILQALSKFLWNQYNSIKYRENVPSQLAQLLLKEQDTCMKKSPLL